MFNRLRSWYTKAATIVNPATFYNGFDNSVDISNTRAYDESLYLFIGVSMIAKRVARNPFALYQIINADGDVDEVVDHPILEALGNPNDRQTYREFMELSAAYYLLSGDAFWYREEAKNGDFIAHHTLRPDYTEIVMNADRTKVVAYEYQQGNGRISIAPEQVLHFRNPDPDNPIRGIGIVRPARRRILTEKEASNYQANFFKNQGQPNIAVFSNGPVNDELNNESRARWKKTFGKGGGGGVAFFGKDVKSLHELNKTPKEMDFKESLMFLRNDILAALHIPKQMVDPDVNYSNSKAAKRQYLEEAVVPVLDAFADVINAKWIEQADNTLFIEYENPVPEDREALVTELKELTGKVYTQNEARQRVGLEPIDGHDELGDINQQAAQQTAKRFIRTRPLLHKRLRAQDDMIAATLRSKGVNRQRNSIFTSDEQREAYAKAFNARIDRKAGSLETALNSYNDEQMQRVLEHNKNGVDPEMPFDLIEERIAGKQKFTPIIQQLYADAGQQALNDIAGKKNAENFFASEELKAAVAARVEFFVETITQTTYDDMQRTIRNGMRDGKGVDAIAREIRDVFAGYKTARLKTIARTETSFALSKATDDAYRQSSVVTGKEWITVEDGNVREAHKRNHGVIVAKEAAFPDGEHYPGEHSVNCRCTLAPAI